MTQVRERRRALVVFSGRADLPWLRLLKPGFRHCFVAVEEGGGWLVCEALSQQTRLHFLDLPAGADLAARYRAAGLVVIETRLRPPPSRPAPWAPYTCVEAVKRLLGLHARRVLTPWRLYRYLENNP